MRHQLVVDVVMLQQDTRSAGVLRQHEVNLFQYADCSKSHVLHITYWGRYDVQNTHNSGQRYKIEARSVK